MRELSQVLEEIRNWLSRRRRYAPYFLAPTHVRTERRVVQDFLDSMAAVGLVEFKDLRPSTQDPPDCLLTDLQDGLVGVEVTELVSEDAVRANQHGRSAYFDWEPADIRRRVGERIREKDLKAFYGGPYSRRMVVVHSAEPVLTSDLVEDALRDFTMTDVRQFTDGFVLLNYEAQVKRCPFIRVALSK
jgi:hypothetical protein